VSIFISCGIGYRAGPDYERPTESLPAADSFLTAETDTSRYREDIEWWMVFGDETIDTLVIDAIEHNLDIQRASAVVREFQARYVQARANRFPSIYLGGDYLYQELPDNAYPPGGAGQNTESFNASLAATFELDLWGKMSRGQEAATADLLQSIENRNTIIHSVIAETITLYLQLEALERRIRILDQTITTLEKSVRTVDGRYRRGLASMLELKQSQRALAGAEAQIPQLRQELGVTQHRLSVLIGRYPETRPPRLQPEEYFERLEPVPAGLPSDLLENRPDIRAAEAKLRSLNAQYGIAKANLYPRITLTGNYGYTSSELDNLFTPSSILWNFMAGLTQPVFNAGKLLAEKDAAEARYRQGVIDYAKTVLNAFAEVESALLIREEQIKRREYLVDYLEKARITQEIAENRYERGLIDYLNVLDAMQARYTAEESLVLVDLTLLSNRVTLHRAMGGNWIAPTREKDESQ
jgi:multidrug efflux system outer membrane protein